MLLIENVEGKIHYLDIDSMVTDIKIFKYMISLKNLGKFKLVYKIDKSIFINSKIYYFITNKVEFINKTKGVEFSFNLLIGNNITIAIKS